MSLMMIGIGIVGKKMKRPTPPKKTSSRKRLENQKHSDDHTQASSRVTIVSMVMDYSAEKCACRDDPEKDATTRRTTGHLEIQLKNEKWEDAPPRTKNNARN